LGAITKTAEVRRNITEFQSLDVIRQLTKHPLQYYEFDLSIVAGCVPVNKDSADTTVAKRQLMMRNSGGAEATYHSG